MQGLDAPVHDLGKACDGGYRYNRNAGVGQRSMRAAGRENLDVELRQGLGEVHYAGLVRDAYQSALCPHVALLHCDRIAHRFIAGVGDAQRHGRGFVRCHKA